MTWFAVKGRTSGELLSLKGALLVHPDRAELEFLIPGFRVVAVTGGTPEEISQHYGRPVMRWVEHPQMAAVTWPLNRRDFL